MPSFFLEDVSISRTFPKWNFSVVPTALLIPGCEPLASATLLQCCSYPWLRLLVSEHHALNNSSLTHSPYWSSIALRSLPEFMAKNQTDSFGPLGHRHCGPMMDHPDELLYLIRALKYYHCYGSLSPTWKKTLSHARHILTRI